MTTTLSSKGQIVIPAKIRQALALTEGALIDCEVVDGKIILDPAAQQSKAQLKTKGNRPVLQAPSGAPEMTPELVRDLLHS